MLICYLRMYTVTFQDGVRETPIGRFRCGEAVKSRVSLRRPTVASSELAI
jgi:hypothetical protein